MCIRMYMCVYIYIYVYISIKPLFLQGKTPDSEGLTILKTCFFISFTYAELLEKLERCRCSTVGKNES